MPYRFLSSLPLILMLGLTSYRVGAVVNLPYTNNFDSDLAGGAWEDPGFLTSSSFGLSGNSWQITSPGIGGSGNGLQSILSNSSSTIYNAATVQSIIPAPLPIYLSADFQLQSRNTSGNSYIGLALYGSRPDLGIVGVQNQGGNFIWPYLQAAGSGAGSVGFANFVNANGNNTGITINSQSGANLAVNTSDIYNMAITGVYDANTNLTITFTVTDKTTSAMVSRSEVVSASALANFTGSSFGIVDRINSGTLGTQTVLQDNFSLSSSVTTNFLVDEPRNLYGWSLNFSDEFDGSQLNTNKWATTYMWGGSSARTLPGNDEMEIYRDNQFVETNGILRIRGDKLDSVWYGSTYHYASGLIDTYQKFSQLYGYFEMRARLPHGNGLWPAFWMMYDYPYWPPEIDILEILDSAEDQPHTGAIQNGKGSYFAQFNAAFNTTTAYHVYSLEWSPSNLTYFLDGQEVAQTHVPTNTIGPMQILANLAIGGLGTIPPDASTMFPAYMDIDYIRVWSRTNSSVPIPYTVGYDIGNVGLPGSTMVNSNGTAVVSGAGSGFLPGSSADSFQFAAQPISGEVDYDYQLEISSMPQASGQVGVMIRQTTDPSSQYSTIYLNDGYCIFQSRTNYGGIAIQTASVAPLSSTNLWLRLYRRGNAVTAYQSTNGISWTYIAAITNAIFNSTMGSSAFVGAAVSSGSTNNLNIANINSLNIPAAQVIQTVADPSGVILTGPWISQNAANNGGTGGYYGSEYLSDNKINKGQCFAKFIPAIPDTAYYDVYMEWLGVSHAASNTPVAINYQGGSAQVLVNEQHEGGEWVYIGTFPFAAGTNGSLTISNPSSTSGYGVIANAVRFIPGAAILPAQPTIPAAPTGLVETRTPGNTEISLQWNPADGATSYNVKRGITSGGPYTNIASGVLTSTPYFTDSNVVAGTKYYYVVTAVNNTVAGEPPGQESAFSNEASGIPSIISDNADAAGVTITGSWTASTTSAGYYGSNYLQDGAAGGGKSVRFSPELPVAGVYDVFMRWTSETNNASNTPVDVIYNGGTNTISLNQQVSDGVWWVYLGTYDFDSGANNAVVVRDDGANGTVIADAVEFVYDSQKALTVSRTPEGVVFSMQSISGNHYQLQETPNLSPANWQNVASMQTGTGETLNFTDPNSGAGTAGFYRVQITP